MQMIEYESRFKTVWEAFILLLTIAVTLVTPISIIFNLTFDTGFLIFDLIVTFFFLIDILLTFNTTLKIGRHYLKDRKSVAKHYLKRWFIFDALATIPFHIIFLGIETLALGRFLRFFRLARLFKLLSSTKTLAKVRESKIFNPSIVRLMLLIFWILIASHLIACGWIFITGDFQATLTDTYIKAYYWTITTVTTIGYGDISPAGMGNLAIIYTIIIEIIGAGMYGFIIGNIANLIANIDVAKSQYREKMEKISTFLKYRNVPVPLQKRINDYYDYLWENRRGYDESAVMEDLPISLKTTVSLYLNKDIIEKVPLFKGASQAFIREIIMNLKPVIFTPGDYIVRAGEIGDEMYFISHGSVDVVSEDESTVYATLTAGNFFGEIALLLSTERTATIKAREYCDLYALDKTTFDRILSKYPDFARDIEELAEKRRAETKTNNGK